MKKLSLFSILISLAMGMTLSAPAQTNTASGSTNSPSPKAAKPEKKAKAETFSGKLGAVDNVNKTITLDDKAKRMFLITSDSLITTNGKPAILSDAVVGEPVHGTYTKTDDGKLSAKIVSFGGKSESAKASTKPKKSADTSTNAPAKP